jgi:hypothetical protein
MKRLAIGISTFFGLALGYFLGINCLVITWFIFGDNGTPDIQIWNYSIIGISIISFGIVTFIIIRTLINKTIYKVNSSLKYILLNNIFAISIHIVVSIIEINLSSDYIFLDILVLILYLLFGYFAIGQGSKVKNYLSVSGVMILSLFIWGFQNPDLFRNNVIVSGYSWIPVYFSNVFSFIIKLGITKWISVIIISFLPSLFIWFGIELKSRKLKTNALPGC